MKINSVVLLYALGIILTIVCLSIGMYTKPDVYLWSWFGYDFGISRSYAWLKIITIITFLSAILLNRKQRQTA